MVRQQIATGVAILIIMVSSGLVGMVAGVYYATGHLPGQTPLVILPDIGGPTTTLIEVGHFLERDKTDEITYEEGFNCVEYGLLVARNAHWYGLPVEVGSLVYEGTEVRHLVLMFPTEDDGWVFVDPQADLVINPRPGLLYNGCKIARIDILRAVWEVFAE